jgi:hypothetical protein
MLTKNTILIIFQVVKTMISKIEGKKIHLIFDIGEYDPVVVDYLSFLNITSRSKATSEEIEELTEEIKSNWWKENKEKYLSESGN